MPKPTTEHEIVLIELSTFASQSDDPGCGDCMPLQPDQIERVTASSFLQPDSRHGPAKVVDDEASTAWCEGAEGDGRGAWVELRLREPLPVDSIIVHPGYLKSRTTLFDNGRPAILLVTIDSRDRYRLVLPEYPVDYVGGRGYVFPSVELSGSPIQRVRLTLEKIHAGKATEDTCLSGVRLEVLVP